MDKIINFLHKKVKECLTPYDIAIDMTMGNGHDSLFLCENSRFVYCFDIQQTALDNTDRLLKEKNCNNYKLIKDSHEFVLNYVTEDVKAIVFNLGYLPSGDKNITTKTISTIKALDNCLKILKVNGRVAICVYPGHEEGKNEEKELLSYVSSLNQKQYEVLRYQFINQINNPPFLIIIERIK